MPLTRSLSALSARQYCKMRGVISRRDTAVSCGRDKEESDRLYLTEAAINLNVRGVVRMRRREDEDEDEESALMIQPVA